jgi:hypothetical protein
VEHRGGLDLLASQVTLAREESKEQMVNQESRDLKGYRDYQDL